MSDLSFTIISKRKVTFLYMKVIMNCRSAFGERLLYMVLQESGHFILGISVFVRIEHR